MSTNVLENAVLEQMTVGELVREYPRLSRIFQTHQIDFCCGGKKPLTEAAEAARIPVAQLIESIQAALAGAEQTHEPAWDAYHLSDLCQHIYTVHHEYLYRELPRLETMLEKVVRVHGEHNPTLYELQPVFLSLKSELEIHMQKEERVLFPYCSALDMATRLPEMHCGSIRNPIIVMEREHDDAGQLLAQIRRLTVEYTPPDWACNTYRALIDGLHDVEVDIHLHIHKENNILFPLAIQRAQGLSGGDLPSCSL